jgi:hypothetical protein
MSGDMSTAEAPRIPRDRHRAKRAHRRWTRLAFPLVTTIVALLTGCGAEPDDDTSSSDSSALTSTAGCPRAVTNRLDLSLAPDRRDVLDLDLSGSGGATMETLEPQIKGVVSDAVAGGASLVVSVVGASATDLTEILSCPRLAPLVNDEDARQQATEQLLTAATRAVVQAYPELDQRAGSDLYGAFLAESGRLTSDVPTRIVAFSDGMQVGPTDVPLSLPGVVVEMYGVGRLAVNGVDSAQAVAVRDDWTRLLSQAGAVPAIRFTPYVAGQVTQ